MPPPSDDAGSRDPDGSEGTVVAHWVPHWLGQTQTWIYNQVRFLSDDIAPHVVTENTRNLDQFRVPRIHALDDRPLWTRALDHGLHDLGLRRQLRFLGDTLRRLDADLLHSHFGNIAWKNVPTAERVGVRHVVTFYGHDVHKLPRVEPVWRDRYAELFASADRVLCEGPKMREQVIDLGAPPDLVAVHHLGVDLGRIPHEPRSWEEGEPLRVLFAAAFTEKKGLPYGLEAVARLADDVPVEVTIVGGAKGGDNPEADRIRRVLDEEGLRSRTRMPGFLSQDELMAEALDHHVFVAPSVTASDGDNEGGAPVTVIEMAASGMPIVASRHCDIPEIVRHGETGLLADERDVDGLVEALRWLVDRPDRWEDLARNAREHVEAEYSARRQGRRLAERYRELTV